ncbi:transglycosylase SLT domain-containing protein [Desulfosediminicola flagellatus]|uniref:transglycosylase SLT domain-containing protein n=1 Tax=Desulfosediminicola flagellatus TaxID=2569541 RepID=UPI0010AD74DA|nr:transglycosylase SLT domain-containing protein [Desulfosediminicola flagellatus]
MLSDTIAKQFIASLTLALLLLSASYTMAAVYTCRDANGSIRFTNAPSTSGCTKIYKEQRFHNSRPTTYTYSSSSYDQAIWTTGVRYNVDPFLIKAVIRAESDFNSTAVSKKGAQGLMQLMPATARELRVDNPFDPQENIDGGTRYLRQMLDIFDDNLMLSIAAYNAGPGAVKRANGVPRIPETLRYVTKVLKHYKGYRNRGRS